MDFKDGTIMNIADSLITVRERLVVGRTDSYGRVDLIILSIQERTFVNYRYVLVVLLREKSTATGKERTIIDRISRIKWCDLS